ncbi:MAG: carbohydrate kinase family protein [Myxococcota bacterium]
MRVLSVGYCTLDHFAVVERFLEPDFKMEMSKFSVQGGGSAATAITTLSRWGVDSEFIGKVGSDARGDQIIATLTGEDVDCEHMVVEDGAISQFSFITVEDGTGRKKTVFTRGNVSELRADEIDESVLDDVDYLLVDGQQPDAQLALSKAARQRDITVIFDASSIETGTGELVENCDLIIASERFASQFTGVGRLERICEVFLERGPGCAVVTLGDEGVVGMNRDDNKVIRVEPHPVDVFDTTGAGDVFLGAMTYAMIHDFEFERAMRFANTAAALSCVDIGGRGPIPEIAAVEAAMEG